MIELNCKKSLNGADGKFELDVNLNDAAAPNRRLGDAR